MITKDVSKAPEKIRIIVSELNSYFERDDTLQVSFPFCGLAVVLMPPNRCYMKCRLIYDKAQLEQ